MLYLVVCIGVLAYGAWYAADPMRFLKRKYMNDKVPESAVRTARAVGVVLTVLGAIGAVYYAVQVLTAG